MLVPLKYSLIYDDSESPVTSSQSPALKIKIGLYSPPRDVLISVDLSTKIRVAYGRIYLPSSSSAVMPSYVSATRRIYL